ncbi:uncharacterized protein LOC110712730 [Chenopodium quinoa]|uniref:uncharacterized protein LOC110712730 n=1 Tax=Chenopodium quinoa TaxID=63459 RepID=UPI000B775807|nr:uncharacterized protein LOC110712730 [Chenopodium quinoa]
MTNYAKFLKEILSGRRTCDMAETVSLTENCSATIMNKTPPKLKDPGNFSIPCAINKTQIDNVLCDLGASVSLMPYSVYQRLELGELSPTNITLQLADRPIKIPQRPFLATSGAMIDVKSAKISLKVGEEEIEFDMNESIKYPSSLETCMRIKILDDILNSMQMHLLASNDPLECVLLNKEKIGDHGKEMNFLERVIDESLEGSDEKNVHEVLKPRSFARGLNQGR